jgi:hypothetical protein
MLEPTVIFCDYPDVCPEQQDNPVCMANCRAQGRFVGESCVRRDVSSLRQAVELGYTKAKWAAAYSPDWLDRSVQICHCGHVLLALDQAPDENPLEASAPPEEPASLDRATVVANLTALRREVEAANLSQERFTPPFALVLSDVCHALGLTRREHDQILGPEASRYVARIRKQRWWPAKGSPWQHLARLLPRRT